MAERRMFAKTIIDSDAFLDMSLSAQALYFHLSMRADDEGFVNNFKKVMRMINASQGDLESLNNKKFIILFESGVIVIKHWKLHNYIQNDRFKKTLYTEEKAQLVQKENKVYTLDTECIQNGDTGKVRLGKVSIVKSITNSEIKLEDLEEVKEVNERIDYKKILDYWNSKDVKISKIREITTSRKKHIKARLDNLDLDTFLLAIDKLTESDFCNGNNDHKWLATFDWLIKNDNNINKVLEDTYKNKKQTSQNEYNVEVI